MARKVAQRGDDDRQRTDESNGSTNLGRRAYVKLGATALVAGAGLSAASTPTTASGEAYDTIKLEPGEQRAYDISDGETFENVLIDQTADGAMFSLRVEEDADDWTIRNVGWKGLAPSGGAREFTFLIHVRGHGVIENIFIDQRNHDGGKGSDVGGIWTYSGSHHGHIECRHNFIAGCGNNASYTSGDGWNHNDATGTVEHYRSYHRDNTVSNFRPGRPECYVRECVSVVNDPDGTRGGYPSTGSQMSRAVWAWHHPNIYVENCAIWHDPNDVQPAEPFWATLRGNSEANQCELHIVDCDINESWTAAGNDVVQSNAGGNARDGRTVTIDGLGNEPDVSILGEGVPTTPEMAAAGERNLPPELGTAPSGGVGEFGEGSADVADPWTYEAASGVHTELPYELVIEQADPGARVTYEVEFDGTVELGEWKQNAIVTENQARGGIGPQRGLDNVYFDGQIVDLGIENGEHARLLVADAQTREIVREFTAADVPFDLEEAAAEAAQTEEHDDEDADEDEGSDKRGETTATPPGTTLASGLASVSAAGFILRDRFE